LCAAGVVDAVLIPEVPFTIKGDNGLFKYLDGVLEKKGHCVVCVAEGAGQVDRHGPPRMCHVQWAITL
jgi:6-phosphofructokinase 1